MWVDEVAKNIFPNVAFHPTIIFFIFRYKIRAANNLYKKSMKMSLIFLSPFRFRGGVTVSVTPKKKQKYKIKGNNNESTLHLQSPSSNADPSEMGKNAI